LKRGKNTKQNKIEYFPILKHFFSNQTIFLIVIDSTKSLEDQSKELSFWMNLIDIEVSLSAVSLCIVMTKSDNIPKEMMSNHSRETKKALMESIPENYRNIIDDDDGIIFTSCLDRGRYLQRKLNNHHSNYQRKKERTSFRKKKQQQKSNIETTFVRNNSTISSSPFYCSLLLFLFLLSSIEY